MCKDIDLALLFAALVLLLVYSVIFLDTEEHQKTENTCMIKFITR